MAERFQYEPYGQVAVDCGAQSADAEGHAWYCLREGLCSDGGTSTLHRFCHQDPLGYVDGMSLYEYVRSGPSVLVDPTGTRSYLEVTEHSIDIRVAILYVWDRCDPGGTSAEARQASEKMTENITRWWNAMLRNYKVIRPTADARRFRYFDLNLTVEPKFVEIDSSDMYPGYQSTHGKLVREWYWGAHELVPGAGGYHRILLSSARNGNSEVQRMVVGSVDDVPGKWYWNDSHGDVTAPHEVGHLLGLDDHYDPKVSDFWRGNIMGGLRESVYAGQVQNILSNLDLSGSFKVASLGSGPGRITDGSHTITWGNHEIIVDYDSSWYENLAPGYF